MKRRLAVAVLILSVVALIFGQAAVAADSVKDAKAAYSQFVKAAKAKKMEEVKKLLAKDALSDLEKDNMLDLFTEMQAEIKPETIKAAKADVTGSMVVLKIEQVEKTKEGTSTTKMTVYMVKEGGKWKVGKPEGAK
ncbi:MAG: nuclear transport factor 2 family protein [Nitrospiraceae bacterium]|nr:nuclear transport factor 2 family protein [Nitrospiraceae bacterium]